MVKSELGENGKANQQVVQVNKPHQCYTRTVQGK